MRKLGLWIAATGVLALSAPPVAGPILFDEIAEHAGIHFITNSSPTPEKHQPETMVAGVAVFDYDGDGYPDIFFVNGAEMPSLDKRAPRFANRLFRNDHDLTFTDVTDKAGVAGTGYGMGVAIGDYDNDGHPDIFVANLNGNQLLHNNGDGTFTDVTEKAGLTGAVFQGRKMWSASAAWVDYDRDGLLDLFVANYCQWDAETEPSCVVNGNRIACSPRYYKPLYNTLYHNNGDGTFTDVSEQTGIAGHFGKGMGIGIGDYDGDGYPDIFIANDTMPNQLFRNLGGKRFEEVAMDAGVAFPEDGNAISGMGVVFSDLFNRGHLDIWETAIEKQTFPLFRELPSHAFEDATAATGLALETAGMSGWSNLGVDFDNDGWKDLFVARSNVIDNVALFEPRQYGEPNSIFRNLGNGRFANVGAQAGKAFQLPAAHRGAAFGDFDNDGRVDLVVSVLNGQAKIFRNITANGNHWLTLQLEGRKSNRMAIGARVRLTTANGVVQYDHVSTSSGYASSSDPRLHFGFGSATSAKEIEILWPSGIRQVLQNVSADRILKITEPER